MLVFLFVVDCVHGIVVDFPGLGVDCAVVLEVPDGDLVEPFAGFLDGSAYRGFDLDFPGVPVACGTGEDEDSGATGAPCVGFLVVAEDFEFGPYKATYFPPY